MVHQSAEPLFVKGSIAISKERGSYFEERIAWGLCISSCARKNNIMDYYQRGRSHQAYKQLPFEIEIPRHPSLSITQTGQ